MDGFSPHKQKKEQSVQHREHSPLVPPPKPPMGPAHLTLAPDYRKRWLWPLIILGVAVLFVATAVVIWYNMALMAVNNNDQKHYRITIETGMTPVNIAKELKAQNIIRDTKAFQLYTQLNGKKDMLQAGTYLFSPKQTLPQIVDDLVAGKTDSFNVTILPGATIVEIIPVLEKAGYSKTSIETALKADYSDIAVLSGKPAGTSLEGYLYPDTYRVDGNTTAGMLIRLSIKEFDKKVTELGIGQKLAAENLSLYQGITLASIVSKETSGATDQKQVAQVFLKRFKNDIELGSDVTYMYGASILGVKNPAPDLVSPYNTRVNKGLPPGPIASFTISALQAVAEPAPGEYLYFVAGDDGTTHYAYTLPEHEANTAQYCSTLCQ